MPDTETVTTVTTLDNETVSMSDALTLNWDRVLAAKQAARHPALKGALQGLLDSLKSDPRRLAVARLDTPQAQKLATLIESITVNKATAEEPLWVPLVPVLEAWEKRRAEAMARVETRTQTAGEAAATAIREAEERARRNAEKRKAETEAAQTMAAALGEFIPADVQAERDERRGERRDARAEVSALEDLIGPFVSGQGVVNDNRQPSAIVANEQTVQVSDFRCLASQVKDGVDAAHVIATCAFCRKQSALGETMSWRKRLDDGSIEDKQVFAMRQIQLACRTADGRHEYTFTRGPREGQIRKMNVVVCRRCAGIATRLSPSQADSRNPGKTMPSVLPVDVYPKFVQWLASQQVTSDSRVAASVGPDGKVQIVEASVKPLRNATARPQTSGGPSGPIGNATPTGQSVNPAVRDESFVAPAAESPRLVATIGDRVSARRR